MTERTIAPDCREGERCPRCGRIVRRDPKTPGCYLGRCTTIATDAEIERRRRHAETLAAYSTPTCLDELHGILIRPTQLALDLDGAFQ